MFFNQIKELKDKLCSLNRNSDENLAVDATLVEAILDPIKFWGFTRDLFSKQIIPSPQFKECSEVEDVFECIKGCNESDKIYYTLNYIALTNSILKPVLNKFFKDLEDV